MYVFAFDGTQLPVVMVSVTGSEPVFFTYIILVVELLGYIDPQFIDVKF
jgi:hypothetical protein